MKSEYYTRTLNRDEVIKVWRLGNCENFVGKRVGAHENLNGSRDLTMPFSSTIRTCYLPSAYLQSLKSLTPLASLEAVQRKAITRTHQEMR